MEGLELSKVIAVLINFAILYGILRHFFFKPVNTAINKRQTDIVEKITKTDEDLKAAEELRSENEKRLADAKNEGKAIVENFKNKATALHSDMVSEAREEAEAIVKRAKIEAQRVKDKAEDEMKNQVIDLAVLLSTKAIEESVSEEQHRRLINDFILKVGM